MILDNGILRLFKVFNKERKLRELVSSIDETKESLLGEETGSSTIPSKSISLEEQLSMISRVDEYLIEYEGLEENQNPDWQKGFTMGNVIYETSQNKNQAICRANMEVYFQEKMSGERKMNYIVSLIKLPEDQWHIMQVKIQT